MLRRTVYALGAVAALGACTPFTLSPPARTVPLESSATLEEGQASVQVAGSYFDILDLGGDSGSASVRGRVGLTSGVELQVEGSYIHIDYRDERSPHLGAGRAGVKIAPVEWVGLVAGVGAGSYTHGAFVSPDLGVVFAYENPYVVPWGAVRGFVSVPIDPRTVVVTDDDDMSLHALTPPNTAGWQLSTGIRVPIALTDDPRPRRGTRIDLLVGGAMTRLEALEGSQNTTSVFQIEAGIEIVIDPSIDTPPSPEL